MSAEVEGDCNDIIEIDEQGLPVQPTQDLLYESLECGRSGRKSERQHLLFPESISCNKRGLVLCFRTQGHLPIPAEQIQRAEELATSQGI